MFDFLIKQKTTKNYSGVETILHHTNEPCAESYTRQQLVENFVKKNKYHGKSMMQYALKCLSMLAKEKEISQGAFFISDVVDSKSVIKFLTAFASPNPDNRKDILEIGEGFPGQVAKDGKMINISDIPEGYLTIESGLGKSAPVSLILFPVKYNDKILAVIELASFRKFTEEDELFFNEISGSIAEQMFYCTSRL